MFNGHQLQILRQARGLTREQLADQLVDVSPYVGVVELDAFERGRQTPTTEALEVIASALGVSPLTFLVPTDSVPLPRRVIRAVLEGLDRSDVAWATGHLEGALSAFGYDYQEDLHTLGIDEALEALVADMGDSEAGDEVTEWPACDADDYPIVDGELRSVGGQR